VITAGLRGPYPTTGRSWAGQGMEGMEGTGTFGSRVLATHPASPEAAAQTRATRSGPSRGGRRAWAAGLPRSQVTVRVSPQLDEPGTGAAIPCFGVRRALARLRRESGRSQLLLSDPDHRRAELRTRPSARRCSGWPASLHDSGPPGGRSCSSF
jgi:hypothetical protein